MRSLKTIPLAFLPILLVNTSAIPQPATEQGCVVPLGIFNTLDKPFTLSALIPDLNSLTRETTIPVRIDPFTPNEKTASKPIISRAKIASTKFTLKDNKLIAADFEASLLPTTKIFPPPPQGFEFSVDTPVAPAKFRASYACDNNGALFLELRDISYRGFGVKKVAEGEQIYIIPKPSSGQVVKIPLKINGGL